MSPNLRQVRVIVISNEAIRELNFIETCGLASGEKKSHAKLLEILIADFSLRAKFFYFGITTAPFEMTTAKINAILLLIEN
jgi:hypothetical protein